jgi:hypothetical protein
MNDRIGFVIVAKRQPVRTGRRALHKIAGRKSVRRHGTQSEALRKGAKLYRYSGMARRFAREKQAVLGEKVAVLCAVINIDNPNRFDQIGYAVITNDGKPVKTGTREPTAKLYQHLGFARRVAKARQAKVAGVYV